MVITDIATDVISWLNGHSGLIQAIIAGILGYITYKFNRVTHALLKSQTVPNLKITKLMLSSSLAYHETLPLLRKYMQDSENDEYTSTPDLPYSLFFEVTNSSSAIGSVQYPTISVRNKTGNWRLQFTNVGKSFTSDEILVFNPEWPPSERLAYYEINDRLFARNPIGNSVIAEPRRTVSGECNGMILFDANSRKNVANLIKYFDELIYCIEFRTGDERKMYFETTYVSVIFEHML